MSDKPRVSKFVGKSKITNNSLGNGEVSNTNLPSENSEISDNQLKKDGISTTNEGLGDALSTSLVKSKIKIGTRRRTGRPAVSNAIPDSILQNAELTEAINALLPKNYNFEIYKTVWQIQKLGVKRVALQFPEGLLMYSLIISDILEKFCSVEIVVMGDVTYGACCIDDYSAVALGCDFMVHYGHSCLVPVSVTLIKTMYVFVEIGINLNKLTETIRFNFSNEKRIALVGVVQFLANMHQLQKELKDEYDIYIPQIKPLSPGEILGCTSPKLLGDENDTMILFIGDGRFHLESILISNPNINAFAYDPYSNKITREKYNHEEMFSVRQSAIAKAKKAKTYGLILGTLGRQGSNAVLDDLADKLEKAGKEYVVVLLSEIFPAKLKQFEDIDCWIQISCPRLSIDWGYAFEKPLLSPYEAAVALEALEWQAVYPMDFYANESMGSFTPNHKTIPESLSSKVIKSNV
ncbi:Diphthamide biosynthesis protein 1 [Smittium mucronatum]|uniref:2-(3-amino-3-carboxypropyl)histidine synthase subunit 1 n=1 Tax=Smittium mucronatum TaxID=133383 RepID=A0A1R0GUI2_9FUNG|nr:Diphthamide biosynthesis protein 1 [Smittium mucronatum]